MAKDERSLPSLDTEPPPPSGDAYSAETVQRQIPPELLAAAKAQLVPRAPRMPNVPRPPRPEAAAAPPIAKLGHDDAFDEAETQLRPLEVGLAAGPGAGGAHSSPAAAAVGSVFGSMDSGPAIDAPSATALATDRAATRATSPAPSRKPQSWSWMVFFVALVVTLFIGIVLRTYVIK